MVIHKYPNYTQCNLFLYEKQSAIYLHNINCSNDMTSAAAAAAEVHFAITECPNGMCSAASAAASAASRHTRFQTKQNEE